MLQPYLPPTEAELLAAEQRSGGRSRFGIRKALRSALNLLVYNLIHTVFSIYIRIRQAYHTVAYRVLSILYYHHRTPELIDRDVKGLKKKPRHLSVILKLDDERGGAGLERLVNEAAEIAAWCACAGIPMLSIYEKTGECRFTKPTKFCNPVVT